MKVTTYIGKPSPTVKGASTDAAQSLENLGATIPDNCVGGYITCETQPVRFAYGATPTNDAGTGLGHILAAGGKLDLESGSEVRDVKLISQVGGAHAALQITLHDE